MITCKENPVSDRFFFSQANKFKILSNGSVYQYLLCFCSVNSVFTRRGKPSC